MRQRSVVRGSSIVTGLSCPFRLCSNTDDVVSISLLFCAMLFLVCLFSAFLLVSNVQQLEVPSFRIVIRAQFPSNTAASGLFSFHPVPSVVEDPYLRWYGSGPEIA